MKNKKICITLATCVGIVLSLFAFSGCKKWWQEEEQQQKSIVYSQGLEYMLNSENTYTVQGIGSCISTEIAIPPSYNNLPVTEIAARAFCGLEYIQTVYISDSIQTIGAEAFKDCTALERVEYLQSTQIEEVKEQKKSTIRFMKDGKEEEDEIVRAKRIYEEAFMNCIRMEEIVLPEGVEEIARDAFGNCGMMVLYTMANNLNMSHMEIIWNWIYDNPVVLNCLLNNIATDGYRYATVDKIQYAIKDNVAMVKKIPNYLLQVNIPEEIEVYGTKFPVTSIHPNVARFSGEETKDDVIQWNTLTIPKTITEIPEGAFNACVNLIEVHFPNTLQKIGNGAFSECVCLTKVNFPDSLTSIGDSAFSNCNIQTARLPKNITKYENIFGSALKELILHDGVTDFYGYNLNLKRIELPHTIQKINEDCFSTWDNLQEITIREGENAGSYRTIDGCLYRIHGETLTLLCYPKGKTNQTFLFPTFLTEKEKTTNFKKLVVKQNSILENPYLKKIQISGTEETTIALENNALSYFPTLEEIELDLETVSIGDWVCDAYAATKIFITENVKNLTVGQNNRLYCEGNEEDFSCLSLGANCNIVWDCMQNHVSTDGYIYACIDGISYKLRNETATIVRQAYSHKKVIIPKQVVYNDVSYTVTEIDNLPFSQNSILFFEHETKPTHWTNLTNKYNPNLIFWDYKNNHVASDGNIYVEQNGLLFKLEKDNAILTMQLDTSATVTIPESVSLNGIVYPVRSMTEKVFFGNETLISVTIPKSIQVVSERAFFGCSALQTVTLSSGLVRIKQEAFGQCTSLENVTFPNTLTGIGSFTFSGCSSLKEVVLPDSLENLGDSAFENCYALEKIVVPNTLKRIEMRVLSGCVALKNISLPNNVEHIAENAFANTSLYNDLTNWENGILYIGDFLIKATDVSEKPQIKAGTKGIAEGAFRGCFGLKELILPEGLTYIGSGAFSSCIYLEKIEFPDSLLVLGDNVFFNCRSLQEMVFPETVTKVGERLFANCTSLEELKMPAAMTHIEDYAFAECEALKKVELPRDLESIGQYAFMGCKNLTSVQIPDGVTKIGFMAFAWCESLEEIALPEGLSELWSVFSRCTSLKRVVVPSSLSYVEDFSYCSSLEELVISNGVKEIVASFYQCTSLKEISIPGSVEKLSGFSDCTALEKVTIVEGVREVSGFENCLALTSVVFPDSVQSIQGFTNCPSLKEIVLPDNLSYLDEKSFKDSAYCKEQSNWENGILYIDNCLVTTEEDVVNVEIKEGTTLIANGAFAGRNISFIQIPDSVIYIGDWAFEGCERLEEVLFGNGLQIIGAYAFTQCKMLNVAFFPSSLKEIGAYAFSFCLQLHRIQIPASLTHLGERAFESIGITESENIEFLDGMPLLEHIGADVFQGTTFSQIAYDNDKALYLGDYLFNVSPVSTPKDFVVREGIKLIADGAFIGLGVCETVVLPNTIMKIGKDTFKGCANLTAVIMHNSVERIEENAFYDCYDLSTVFYHGTTQDFEQIIIASGNRKLTEATWYFYSENQPTETSGNYWRYVDGEPTAW